MESGFRYPVTFLHVAAAACCSGLKIQELLKTLANFPLPITRTDSLNKKPCPTLSSTHMDIPESPTCWFQTSNILWETSPAYTSNKSCGKLRFSTAGGKGGGFVCSNPRIWEPGRNGNLACLGNYITPPPYMTRHPVSRGGCHQNSQVRFDDFPSAK
ncbi:hypothetical protein BDP81DRAFT_80412 [Colletotrichum phormii]|uniref:Uncharacterized protein n=1 Tax=Colletotrichum phormii TaxID=359342 RepID=A0AAJ0A1D1_9PEZI|nr:uncharacterized protein BDP81DRAFT_80412 [Colletotrichum phormii]KAK1654269.1 hypothetical protein BDP81DRAFT_80412 [Colletotrichum phormii]